MDIYEQSYVNVAESEKKLELLQKEYSITSYNNIRAESLKAVKRYAESVEQEINVKIDYEVEQIQLKQQEIMNNIEDNLLQLDSKQISALNREFFKYNDELIVLLDDKTSLMSLFNSISYDKIDTSTLELSIRQHEEILSYNSRNNNTYLGELNELRRPYNYRTILTSKAGYRIDPIDGKVRFHSGTDYAMPIGTELYSIFEGIVTLSEDAGGGYGQHVKIDCGNGLILHYAHLNERFVKEGDRVKQNQIIGLSGNTGRSTGPHLHLGFYYKGEILDVERLFK